MLNTQTMKVQEYLCFTLRNIVTQHRLLRGAQQIKDASLIYENKDSLSQK